MEDEGVKGVIFVKEFRSCCLNSCKQHALNQRSPAEGKGKGQKLQKQHALKGQKLLAQGSALGIVTVSNAPCKGKSFINFRVSFKAFALTGRQVCEHDNPGRCPGLRASALYLSLRPVTVGSGRAAYRS